MTTRIRRLPVWLLPATLAFVIVMIGFGSPVQSQETSTPEEKKAEYREARVALLEEMSLVMNDFNRSLDEFGEGIAKIAAYLPLAVGYLALTLPISFYTRKLENRFKYET